MPRPQLLALALACVLGCDSGGAPVFGTAKEPWETDEDGDGVMADADCADDNADVNPLAPELCDGIDNDCDGESDEDNTNDALTWYPDVDGDGFGNGDEPYKTCYPPEDYVSNGDDCNDDEDDNYPGNLEICDDRDNDCDGTADDDAVDPQEWYADLDDDGYGDPDHTTLSCDQPDGFQRYGTDCDDTDGDVHPGTTDGADGVDNDCDGETDEDA